MKRLIFLILFSITLFGADAQLTLEYCLERARDNYPLIKKYDLVSQTKRLSLSDINKGWLPRIGIFAQGTAQNAVSEYPDALKAMLDKTGTTVAGMSKLQYKAGVELNQPIWDGGAAKAQRAVQQASAAQNSAALDVDLYAIRERVENLFFGILLLDEQMAKINSTIELLRQDHTKLKSMVANGIAMQSDADMIEAQLLTLNQQLTEAKSSRNSYRQVLEIFINESIENQKIEQPSAELPTDFTSNRPELNLFSKQLELNNQRLKSIDSSLNPRIAFFAQAFYGYPGFNIFESILSRNPSFNALAGVKISWNIDALYTKNNSRRKLGVASQMVNADRELFLFNTGIKTSQDKNKIEMFKKLVEEDSRIVELRSKVRKAAESQLNQGIIDATTLITKINDENQASLNQTLHEIQLLQAIFQLKNTLNR